MRHTTLGNQQPLATLGAHQMEQNMSCMYSGASNYIQTAKCMTYYTPALPRCICIVICFLDKEPVLPVIYSALTGFTSNISCIDRVNL